MYVQQMSQCEGQHSDIEDRIVNSDHKNKDSFKIAGDYKKSIQQLLHNAKKTNIRWIRVNEWLKTYQKR